MDDIRNAIDTVHQLETKYGLSTDGIVETEQNFEDFKVFIPLIGRFSAGKSALINNLLGWGMEVCVKPQIISGDFRRLFKAETPATFCG